jgi:anaerobic dimethyl sulfoxide reductase subunit A
LAAAALVLAGCTDSSATLRTTADTEPVTEGEWLPVECWAHCGGKCALKAYVVDGICMRLKTDDMVEDSFDAPQRRACARGRSRRLDVFSAQRIKYPMKRKSWQPGGGENAHGELRGFDEWERISWEDALDTIAVEMQRIKDIYGNRAIFGAGWHMGTRAGTEPYVWKEDTALSAETGTFNGLGFQNVLSLFGGWANSWSTMSNGSWYWSPMFYGTSGWNNDRYDVENFDYAICVGINPVVSGCTSTFFNVVYPMKEKVKFYIIDIMYNDTIAALGAEWVPIRPATDKAFYLAMAYVMFTEDDPTTNSIIDWELLERCAIGYDADHMPEGADPQDNFKDYVLGTYDGEPKTPEWAEKITGIPAAKTIELARLMAKDNNTALVVGLGPARTNDNESMTQLHITLGAMGGHMGKSGHMTALGSNDTMFNTGKSAFRSGPWPLPELYNPVDDCMHEPFMWDDLIKGTYHYNGPYSRVPTEMRDIDIKCIYNFTLSVTHHAINMPKAIEFYKSLDLAVVNSIRMDDNARFFDFVLPCITPWERSPQISVKPEYCCLGLKIAEPMYEARSDQWIGAELLTRWGLDPKEAFPVDQTAQHFSTIYGAEILNEDGETWEPLISFTAEELTLFNSDKEPRAEGRISYTELAKTGVYRIKRSAGDNYGAIGGKAFVEDPENNPVSSKSGKIEFYSSFAQEATRDVGYKEISPLPKYVPTTNGYEDTFSDYDAGVKGEYPYQIYNPHYYRSSHSHFDNLPWLREAFIRPVFINAQDATEKGIQEGDTVRVWNNNGSILRPASVTDRIIPGVVGLPHGGQIEIDKETGFNLGGSDNWLTYPTSTGKGTCGFNSNVCNIEKWNDTLLPDWQRPYPMPACQQD